ncbi:kynureninase [Geminicoccaceae bacterium 1502E]|nr:kynureninase [Geminicoccaceae bacterium 1502E]
MRLSREAVEALDREDPLAPFRERFALPEGVVYLDGNSLGALPRITAAAVAGVVTEQWGGDLIRSWNSHDWIRLPQRVAAGIATIVGAAPHEVAVCDSTSVNLFKLLSAALELRPGRRVILSERGNFPTDLYVAQGLARLLKGRIELRLVDGPEEIAAALDDSVAVLMLTHVDYRTGRMHDMAGLTAAAHAAGALALWDLAHSAGAVPLDLAGCSADLAVGCGYKYLNGGPGAPAFLFVAERHQEVARQPLAGWMGHARPFAFDWHYEPAPGIDRFLAGTPPILSLAALAKGVALMAEADMAALRRKSLAMGELLIALFEERLAGHGFELASPREAERRGSQVSLAHEHGYPVMQALIARSVIGDFRAPDLLRFGFAPLYNRHMDVWRAVETLEAVMREESWKDPRFAERAAVT